MKRGEVNRSVKESEHVLDLNNAVGVSKGILVGMGKVQPLNDDGCDSVENNVFCLETRKLMNDHRVDVGEEPQDVAR